MHSKSNKGFVFLSAGDAFCEAYRAALHALQADETSIVVLGKTIGTAGERWLEEQLFSQENVRFGQRIFTWTDWVKSRARSVAILRGENFRELPPTAERQYFRETVLALSEAGQLPLLSELIAEEKFFVSLLDTVRELRLAGIKNRESIERAMDLLQGVRESAYQELWLLSLAFTKRLEAIEKPVLDGSDVLELAKESQIFPSRIFLLGFSSAKLLEVDLLQELAKNTVVEISIAAPVTQIAAAAKAKDLEKLSRSLLFVRALCTNFSGTVTLPAPTAADEKTKNLRFRLLESHTAADEVRAAAAFTRLLSTEKKRKVWLIKPKNLFQDALLEQEFAEVLGSDREQELRAATEFRFTRLFLHALGLREKRYALGPALEYAELLDICRQDKIFAELPIRATRLGIREGLAEWRSKDDPVLKRFVTELDHLHDLFPDSASALDFHQALLQFVEDLHLAEFSRLDTKLRQEKEAHILLAAFLRKSANLATVFPAAKISFSDWLKEYRITLEQSKLGELPLYPPNIQILDSGEWLPPTSNEDVVLFLGVNQGIEPSFSARFFLEDKACRRLSDFLFPTHLQEELEFLGNFQEALQAKGEVLLSRPKFDSSGKELSQAWVLSTLSLENRAWPEFSWMKDPTWSVPESRLQAEIGAYKPEHFSASLLEEYRKCGFLAFVSRVLRLEDREHSPELDVNRMDEGSLAHRVLEIFYGEKNGRKAAGTAAQKDIFRESFLQAISELRVRYYMGSETLFQIQMNQLEETLWLYVEAESAFFAQNPEVEVFACEWEFLEKIEGRPFKGFIDRIDVDQTNGTFFVVDYKIGSTPDSKDLRDFTDFQLYVYLDAAAKKVQLEPAAAYYGSIRNRKMNQGLINSRFNRATKKDASEGKKYFEYSSRTGALASTEEFAALREGARQEIRALLEKIELGSFPVEPLQLNNCEECRVRPACRIRATEIPADLEQAHFSKKDFLALLAPLKKKEESKAKKVLRFNEYQEEALSSEGKLIFLEASAGTGKTTVLVEKIRRSLAKTIAKGLSPFQAVERFFAITFSEKSAAELSQRLSELLVEEYGAEIAAKAQEQVSTIHGFCRRIIGEFSLEAGANPLCEMLDEKATRALQERVLEELFLAPDDLVKQNLSTLVKEYSRREIQEMLEELVGKRALVEEKVLEICACGLAEQKNFLVPEAERETLLLALFRLAAAFYERYDAAKWEIAALDFNDLERLAYKALKSPHVRKAYQESIDLLLVDEFQDTNSVQRNILEGVAQPGWKNVFVVGDAKQSIYRFRDADVSVFQELKKIAKKENSLYELDTNFRSQAHIVDFATAVSETIFPAPDGEVPSFEATWAKVSAKNESKAPVKILQYQSPEEKAKASEVREQEAGLLVELVQKLVGEGKRLDQIAILFRKFSGNQVYLHALAAANIPYRLGSSNTFYRQGIILDGLAMLRTLFGGNNDLALLAVLRSPWVNMSDKQIFSIQQRSTGTSLWTRLLEEEAPKLFLWRRETRNHSLAHLLRKIYQEHPAYQIRQARLQMEKLLTIVAGLEESGLTSFELVEQLSGWCGWEKESEATKESSVAEASHAGAIQLMTVHASKGLEFDVVILPDLESAPPPSRSKLRFLPSLGVSLKTEADEDRKLESVFRKLGELDKERETAELKRLLYVALTRAKEEEYIFLRSDGKDKYWAEWIRETASGVHHERVEATNFLRETSVLKQAEKTQRDSDSYRYDPIPNAIATTSISELAAYQFCAEFHRRKFVQSWDDLVVERWPVSLEEKKALQKTKRAMKDPSAEEVSKLLRKLEIERKERGIALHRVLERVGEPPPSSEEIALWLEEAYVAQGALTQKKEFARLLALDLETLEKFLGSALGQELFSPAVTAFPEIPFQWRVDGVVIHGTIDRLIRHSENRWTVVDYKSSILEDSRERYEFQVAAYCEAVRESLRAKGIKDPQVDGYLVNLFTAESIPVTKYHDDAQALVAAEIRYVRANYQLTAADISPKKRGIHGKELCFSCPYVLHCDVGRDFVLG